MNQTFALARMYQAIDGEWNVTVETNAGENYDGDKFENSARGRCMKTKHELPNDFRRGFNGFSTNFDRPEWHDVTSYISTKWSTRIKVIKPRPVNLRRLPYRGDISSAYWHDIRSCGTFDTRV